MLYLDRIQLWVDFYGINIHLKLVWASSLVVQWVKGLAFPAAVVHVITVVQIRFLAQELPHSLGVAKKEKNYILSIYLKKIFK